MKRHHRPLSVAILAWVYIGVGTVGFFVTCPGCRPGMRFASMASGSSSSNSRRLSLEHFCSGATTGRGWFVLAWTAFHVILSGFEAFHGFAVHGLFCAVIAWILFRPDACAPQKVHTHIERCNFQAPR